VRRRCAIAAVTALALLAICAIAFAKTPVAGKFKASGAVSFKFSIKKGKCVAPPKNLNNPQARRGKMGKGFCFNSGDDPPVNLVCPQGGSISGAVALVSSFSRLRLSKSGSMHLKVYGYTSAPDPVSYTELSIKVSGKKASGFVRATDQNFINGSVETCDTGKLTFSAVHS
jgi:hypothetical protein